MKENIKIYLLAYPDNPVGTIFIKTLLRKNIPIEGIIVENKKTKNNWLRFKKKIRKDGLARALHRFFQVFFLRLTGRNVIGLAKKNDIKVYRVDKFNSRITEELLLLLRVDLLVIVSAPILKDYIFKKARLGCLNAHPGWLPKYRGLGANAYAIKNGDSPGVTVHFIDEGIDTGRIIVREKIKIKKGDTIARINDRAMARGAEMMADVIYKIMKDELEVMKIDEPCGENYRSMPYKEVRKLNRDLRKYGGNHAI